MHSNQSVLHKSTQPTILTNQFALEAMTRARGCRIGPRQNALEVAAHITLATNNRDDYAAMRRCLGEARKSHGSLYCDTAVKVVDACLSQKDTLTAVEAMNAVQRGEIRSKAAGAWAHIFATSKAPAYLNKARAIAQHLPYDESPIAYAEIFAHGCEAEDWEHCYDLTYGHDPDTDNTKWNSRHAEETRASTIVVLSKNGLIDEAISLFATLTRPNPTFRTATAIAFESREREHLEIAISKSRINRDLRLKGFRRLVLLAALLGAEDLLNDLRQGDRTAAEYCYANSIAAAVAKADEGARILHGISEAVEQVATGGESSLALTSYAWALAKCGQVHEAMRVAERLEENLQRCITYLAIAECDADLERVIDLGI